MCVYNSEGALHKGGLGGYVIQFFLTVVKNIINLFLMARFPNSA